MMTTTVEAERFPNVEAGDAEDVVLALETGRALWGQGDPREAVRWLRRAAEHAEESGNDLRALSLARVAADLTTMMQTVPAVAPSDEFADKTEMDARPPKPSSLPPKLPTPPERPTASRRPPPPSAAGSSPSSSMAAAKPVTPRPPSVTPKPPPAVAPKPPGVNGAAGNGASATNGAARASLPPARNSALPRRPSTVPGTVAAPPSAPTASRPNGAPRPSGVTAESPVLQHVNAKRRAAVRVAVSQGANGGGGLRAHILDEGESVPEGAIEALLVPLDPNADLLALD